ncbi:MAG: [FeFe] hydrogenase H-cluster radical SAM maturase HydE [Desulfotomaculaceae bacterium]|nr:[FeFe] hydrogenase H-cluster radical SAM maturase HydE [Desulfotomaculaceae bacterium]MDD4767827.1 [FeFe] hydrogenase H-cluster radical SAM maturase HydE [Desulfotomaculaceae bacterium]
MIKLKPEFSEALERAGQSEQLSKSDLVTFLNADEEESKALFQAADQARRRTLGDEVYFRGIIEFSNHCIKNCLYCGLRRDNKALARYRLKPEEILEGARETARLGCRTLVLQSGEDNYYSADMLGELIVRIKEENDLAITLSLGDMTKEDYLILHKAGADRYLLKLETNDPDLFSRLRPGTCLEERLQRQIWLKETGFQLGSGNMVGLPGQSFKTLAGDVILMRDMEVEMAGIGPFIPNKQTPLAEVPGGSLELSMKTLAAARLAMPGAHLPTTTSIASIHPQGRVKALQCGANVIMPNMTPRQYRESYMIYPGKLGLQDTPEDSYKRAVQAVNEAGRTISSSYGHSLKYEKKCVGI